MGSNLMARLNTFGAEVLSSARKAIPVRFRHPETEVQRFQRIVAGELSRRAVSQDFESFEEANDFDIDDDPAPVSQYEMEGAFWEDALTLLDNRPKDVLPSGEDGGEQSPAGPAEPEPPAA